MPKRDLAPAPKLFQFLPAVSLGGIEDVILLAFGVRLFANFARCGDLEFRPGCGKLHANIPNHDPADAHPEPLDDSRDFLESLRIGTRKGVLGAHK